jgi:hypothetical protein
MPPSRCSFNNMINRWKGEHQTYNQAIDGVHSFDDVDIPGDAVGQIDAYNQVTGELCDLIAKAVANGKTLRAHGSAWSLSKCGVTEHELINTAALTIALQPGPTHLDPAFDGSNLTKLRFVECGVSIASINEYLHSQNLSLKASGSNSGQSLAGVVSTGTHGSAFKFGACQDFVLGLHLILGPTKHVYLQSHSNPVVNQSFCDKFGAVLVSDDTLFYSALVSFGSFGIIHGVMIETRDRFLLRSYRRSYDLNADLWNTLGTLSFDNLDLPMPKDKLYHFEVFFNPNAGTPPAQAIVMMMFEEDWHDYTPPVWNAGTGGLSASGLDIMGQLVSSLPASVAGLIKGSLNDEVKRKFADYEKVGTIRDLFRGEVTRGKTLACGVGLPLDKAVQALNIAFDIYKNFGAVLPLLLSVRYVKGTQATLGFTKFATTCVLELDAVNVPETQKYVKAVWKALEAAGINFTLHWGKFNTYLSGPKVVRMYGQAAVDEWKASRAALMESPDVSRLFDNGFVKNAGLGT